MTIIGLGRTAIGLVLVLSGVLMLSLSNVLDEWDDTVQIVSNLDGNRSCQRPIRSPEMFEDPMYKLPIEELRQFRYVEDLNSVGDRRAGEGRGAREVAQLRPDVILAVAGPVAYSFRPTEMILRLINWFFSRPWFDAYFHIVDPREVERRQRIMVEEGVGFLYHGPDGSAFWLNTHEPVTMSCLLEGIESTQLVEFNEDRAVELGWKPSIYNLKVSVEWRRLGEDEREAFWSDWYATKSIHGRGVHGRGGPVGGDESPSHAPRHEESACESATSGTARLSTT